MWQRADDLRPLFEHGRTAWADVAAELPDTDEIRDGRDKRPTGERVRRTWYEVRLAKGWIRQPALDPTLMLVEVPAKPVQPVAGAFDGDRSLQTFEFKFAGGPKDWTGKPK
jgi:hypothetical protein